MADSTLRTRRTLFRYTSSPPATLVKAFDAAVLDAFEPTLADRDYQVGIQQIERGDDRWLYFLTSDRLANGSTQSRIGRIDTTNNAIDAAWTIAPAGDKIALTTDNKLAVYSVFREPANSTQSSRLALYDTATRIPTRVCDRIDAGIAYTDVRADGNVGLYIGHTSGNAERFGRTLTVMRVDNACAAEGAAAAPSAAENALGFLSANGKAIVYERTENEPISSAHSLRFVALTPDGARSTVNVLETLDF